MEVWCRSRPHVRDPENLVAPGLHLLPRSAVICALAPRISARRRALEGTLDIDDSELSSLRCGCVARLATSLAPDAAPDPLDPRGAPRRCYPPGDEGDADESAPRAGGDPACRLDELMPTRRRPDPEPTLSIFPDKVHIGDRFTDADTGDEWEVVSRPVTYKKGHEVRARGQRPGDPGTAREKYWAAHEKITVQRGMLTPAAPSLSLAHVKRVDSDAAAAAGPPSSPAGT